MKILVTLFVIAALLLLNELWWRKTKGKDELARKVIHIGVGTFAAFWPFYLSWLDIRVLSVAFIVVVLVSKKYKVFKAIHSVDRSTWGEICFAIAVGLVTFITQDRYIYMAALLQMGLADGAAAIIGKKYGSKFKYKLLSQRKSLLGSLTFFVVSLTILVVYAFSDPGLHWSSKLLLVAISATVLENVSVYGLDNLSVPLAVALLLRF